MDHFQESLPEASLDPAPPPFQWLSTWFTVVNPFLFRIASFSLLPLNPGWNRNEEVLVTAKLSLWPWTRYDIDLWNIRRSITEVNQTEWTSEWMEWMGKQNVFGIHGLSKVKRTPFPEYPGKGEISLGPSSLASRCLARCLAVYIRISFLSLLPTLRDYRF